MSASRASRRLLASTLRASQQRPIPTPVISRAAAAIRSIASYVPPHQANAISILPTTVDSSSPEFQENSRQMGEVIARLETLTEKIRQGGPPKAREKHIARKKMLPRDRVTALIDPGTSFLELSPLAGEGLYDEDVPAAGIITGVGVVEGVTCMIVANDSTVKGGTYYPITVKKHLRAQAIAEENKLP
jgi:3-methylcrotonyl-CoA carboxylase beta subunit